jgi:predicted Ser/Thr protein kinase/membrane protein implicated in regulation of membrane protease activity
MSAAGGDLALLTIGQQFGRFRIEAKLGEGGMGVVYRAFDLEFDRTVALKIIRPDLFGSSESRTRFAHEAKAASKLHHPHIVAVHDTGCEQGFDFICMEYVEGETLQERIRRRALGIDEAMRYAIVMADAISAVHGAGILHRDLKPANMVITASQDIKLLDFGLAKFSEPAKVTELTDTRTMCTREGQILGTVSYMSPEQAEGRVVDARSDIFSFGSVLYEMITGRHAFDGESNLATLAAILHESPKPASEITPAVSRELDRVIDKCLEKKPGRRFASMKELKAALEMQVAAESGTLIRARLGRWSFWGKLASVLVLGLALMWWGASHVKPAAIYLFCFVTGFGFSVVAALSGGFHLHVHGPPDVGTGLPLGAGPHEVSGVPGVNAGTIAAFLAWFGGAGYVLAQYFGMGLVSTYITAVALGFGGAVVVFLFVAKVLLGHDHESDPADYDLVGVVGRLSSPIRAGGTGEMIYSQAGARRGASTRSAYGEAIPRGTRVVVIRYERGIAYVNAVADRESPRAN